MIHCTGGGVGKLQNSSDKRPDYLYELNFLGRTLQTPTEFDMIKLKRVIRYVSGTLDYVIIHASPIRKTFIG